ncbi:MAG: hypothetical protein B7Z58_18630 [Acidiphilium sp. 37-64-53]|uniref:glycosyltransferase family 2 protein n=1 Tax=Acidiphilium sp. 37-64-53 TaxID=1970299 RepID=UPI000BCE0407|nr:MAG: hypothetical protein B7Z58_18630 [Acidiphilium sp. 37-64-53]
MGRLGIAITTYNRCEMVVSLCAAIKLFTSAPYDLVICDDGSSDRTVATLRGLGETVIAAPNKGVARNKNRGIWYLLTKTTSDQIILLDDDVNIKCHSWDIDWRHAVQRFGHINYFISDFSRFIVEGDGTGSSPVLTSHLSGAVICFRKDIPCLSG